MNHALSTSIVIGTLLLVVFALHQVFKSFKTRDNAPLHKARAMTRRVEALASRIGEIKAGHDAAHAAIAGLDPGATIDEALTAFILHAPGASLAADADALGRRFDDTGHAPFLAAIAGLALREPESAQAGTPAKLARRAVADVLRRAPPSLASDLADRLARDDPDRWTWLAGEGRILREVATRLRPLDASEAGRVEALDQDLARHRTKRDIEEAERQLAFYEGRADVDSTYVMATEFVRWSLLPGTGLHERFDGLVGRNSGHPSWRELRLRMDLILIERNLHGDVDAATERIAAGFDDPEPFVVDIAVEVATDLIEQGYLDEAFRTRIHDGLRRARMRGTSDGAKLAALEAALERPARGEPAAPVEQPQITVEEAEQILADIETYVTVANPNRVGRDLVRIGKLADPAFTERVAGFVKQRSLQPDWRIVALDMDLVRIDGSWRDVAEADLPLRFEDGAHPDLEGMFARLDAAFDDEDDGVVDNGADIAAIMIEQGYLDDDFRARMRAGLERARNRWGKMLSGLDRLEAALAPLAQSHPLNDARADVSPAETMTRMNDPFNAFLDRDEPVPESASAGPLAGLTLAVKDIYDIAGQKTGGGNPQKLAEAEQATRTAPAVQALLDAGARFVGRTQTDELTFSLMGQNAHFPFPVNPAAPDRVTGGSSSGSAAAVAGGLADIALGSDTGGSIRGPASFCGLVGLRLTHGAVSLDGAMPLAPSLDTFGWFARDIETYARVAEVLLSAAPVAARRDWKPLRLPVLDDLLLGPTERAEYARMAASVAGVVGAPSSAGPFSQSIDDLYWAFRRIQAAEAWAVHGPFISSGDRRLGPGVKERFEFGSTIDAATVERESAVRAAFRAEFAGILGDDGLLVLPTMPGAAPLKETGFDDIQAYRERALRLLCLSGLSGFPQITLPLGRVDGAPFGLSLLGPEGSDRALIELAGVILETAGKP
jgi:amidase